MPNAKVAKLSGTVFLQTIINNFFFQKVIELKNQKYSVNIHSSRWRFHWNDSKLLLPQDAWRRLSGMTHRMIHSVQGLHEILASFGLFEFKIPLFGHWPESTLLVPLAFELLRRAPPEFLSQKQIIRKFISHYDHLQNSNQFEDLRMVSSEPLIESTARTPLKVTHSWSLFDQPVYL